MKTLTLQDLMVKPQPVEIKVGDDSLKVWVRTLSQIERSLAEAGARTASRQLRKVLEDPKSEDHQLLIASEIEDYGVEKLRDLWVQSRLVERAIEINRKTLEDRDKTFVPEPDGESVTMAEVERWENEVEEIEEKRESGVLAAINAARVQLEEEVKNIKTATLKKQAIPDLIDNVIGQFWQREFAAQMLSRGTFKDSACTKTFFRTSEEVKMLRPDILELLTNSHYALVLEPEALKTSGGGSKS